MKHPAIQPQETVIVLDFGGQYNLLIARRVREAHVYCEILPYHTTAAKLAARRPKGIILTGGPASVRDEDAPRCSPDLFRLGVPILGICYGMQLMADSLGGRVERAENREYGQVTVRYDDIGPLFAGTEKDSTCWMSHTWQVGGLPEGFRVIASTRTCPVAAMADTDHHLYGVQFHPEVQHTPMGNRILHNFLYGICGCAGTWKMKSFIGQAVVDIRRKAGEGRVVCALSGGVDSSVCAALVHRAIGNRLTCIFVDHGLLRKNEVEQVQEVFRRRFPLDLVTVDAAQRFLARLRAVTEPEDKRKIIGEEFIRVFEEKAVELGQIDCLVQGTIYPDVIESGAGDAALIKSHHNVGGLPEHIRFRELIEPLRSLFKDEVRKVGLELGLPESLVNRQPFPGPGLAIRIIGEVTEEKLDIVRESDWILREEIAAAGLDREIHQYFTVLTGMKSVGVMGDERSYEYLLAIRAVTTSDFMTADWARIPYDILGRIANRIVNEVRHVNRVVYDITSKPPSTIEWE